MEAVLVEHTTEFGETALTLAGAADLADLVGIALVVIDVVDVVKVVDVAINGDDVVVFESVAELDGAILVLVLRLGDELRRGARALGRLG